MKLSNQTYDSLKGLATIVLPVVMMFASSIGSGLEGIDSELMGLFISIFAMVLGMIVNASSNYYRQNNDVEN